MFRVEKVTKRSHNSLIKNDFLFEDSSNLDHQDGEGYYDAQALEDIEGLGVGNLTKLQLHEFAERNEDDLNYLSSKFNPQMA